MRRLRNSVSLSLALTLVAALLLARFVASAHYHTLQESAAPHSCALCAVAHHAPAENSTSPTQIELALRPFEPEVFTAKTLPAVWLPRFGRAPPLGSPLKSDTAIPSL